MASIKDISLNIGDIVVKATTAPQEAISFKTSEAHRQFQVTGMAADMVLNCRYGALPAASGDQLIFAPTGRWSLSKNGRQYFLAMDTPQQPKRLAILDLDFAKAEVWFKPQENSFNEKTRGQDGLAPVIIDPFEYPLDEVLMINFLAQRRGVIIHSYGMDDSGRGLLFVGSSGAGKSTMARLWEKTAVVRLSDDRIIIRRKNGTLRMYGTPWHGDARISSPVSVQLARIFFLQQASKNYIKSLSITEVATRLLVRCFPPFYDRLGMEFSLEFLAQVAAEVQCFELGFVPDESAVEFVRGLP